MYCKMFDIFGLQLKHANYTITGKYLKVKISLSRHIFIYIVIILHDSPSLITEFNIAQYFAKFKNAFVSGS